jgi:hypothetical protein
METVGRKEFCDGMDGGSLAAVMLNTGDERWEN